MKTSRNGELIEKLITQAWEDQSFKDQLLAHPKETVESLLGQQMNLPEGKRLEAVDQTNPDIIYINIPAEPNMENVELNEEQLEAVAGGAFPIIDLSKLIDLINQVPGEDGYQQ